MIIKSKKVYGYTCMEHEVKEERWTRTGRLIIQYAPS